MKIFTLAAAAAFAATFGFAAQAQEPKGRLRRRAYRINGPCLRVAGLRDRHRRGACKQMQVQWRAGADRWDGIIPAIPRARSI